LNQRGRIYSDPLGDPLEALERQVPFAALEAAQIGTVDANEVREPLLTKPLRLPIRSQVAPDGSLKVALHSGKALRLLLVSLQTDQ
jgi:hypothetical protein